MPLLVAAPIRRYFVGMVANFMDLNIYSSNKNLLIIIVLIITYISIGDAVISL